MSHLRITSSRSNSHKSKSIKRNKGLFPFKSNSKNAVNGGNGSVNYESIKRKFNEDNRLKNQRLKKKIGEQEKMCEKHVRSPLYSRTGDKRFADVKLACEVLKMEIKREDDTFASSETVIGEIQSRVEEDEALKIKCQNLKKAYEIHNRKLEKMKVYYRKYAEMYAEFENMKRDEAEFKKNFVMEIWKRYDPVYGLEYKGSKSIFDCVWS